MALEPWRKAIIKRVEQQTHNTRRYFMEVPELTDFNFKPGQFVTLDLPIDEKPISDGAAIPLQAGLGAIMNLNFALY